MRNKKDIGFDFTKLNGMKFTDIAALVPQMSCEELLTCRIVSESNRVCLLIQRELMHRLENGDQVEIIDGFEKVKKACGTYAYIDGRDYCRYGARVIGFYQRTSHEQDACRDDYCCALNGVDWQASKTYSDRKPSWQQSAYTLSVMMHKKVSQFEIVNQ